MSASGLPYRLQAPALALLREHSHYDENRNHCPREPRLVASVDLSRLASVGCPPPELHNRVGKQSKKHYDYCVRNRRHKEGEFEDWLCQGGSSRNFGGIQGLMCSLGENGGRKTENSQDPGYMLYPPVVPEHRSSLPLPGRDCKVSNQLSLRLSFGFPREPHISVRLMGSRYRR